MARSVKVAEFLDWLKINEHRTWSRERMGRTGEFPSMEVKYFYLSLDTRDMKVFWISTNREEIHGQHQDDAPDILTALEQRLNGEKVEPLTQFKSDLDSMLAETKTRFENPELWGEKEDAETEKEQQQWFETAIKNLSADQLQKLLKEHRRKRDRARRDAEFEAWLVKLLAEKAGEKER